MNIPDLFRRAIDEFGRLVEQIGDDQWDNRTPCPEWSVRDLVNHLVYEDKWVPPLLDGKKLEDVGDIFEGDLLGDAPKKAWSVAADEALAAARRDGAMEATAHLSFGDFPGNVYVSQVLADHVIHAWDLARGIEGDDELDPNLVEFAGNFYAPQVELWRQAGAFGERIEVDEGADLQTKLLGEVGRKR